MAIKGRKKPRRLVRRGIKFPWGEVAAYVGPHVSANALLQHLGKETKKRAAEGRPIPEDREHLVKGPAAYELTAAAGFGDRRSRAITAIKSRRAPLPQVARDSDDDESSNNSDNVEEMDQKDQDVLPSSAPSFGDRKGQKKPMVPRIKHEDVIDDDDYFDEFLSKRASIPKLPKRNWRGTKRKRHDSDGDYNDDESLLEPYVSSPFADEARPRKKAGKTPLFFVNLRDGRHLTIGFKSPRGRRVLADFARADAASQVLKDDDLPESIGPSSTLGSSSKEGALSPELPHRQLVESQPDQSNEVTTGQNVGYPGQVQSGITGLVNDPWMLDSSFNQPFPPRTLFSNDFTFPEASVLPDDPLIFNNVQVYPFGHMHPLQSGHVSLGDASSMTATTNQPVNISAGNFGISPASLIKSSDVSESTAFHLPEANQQEKKEIKPSGEVGVNSASTPDTASNADKKDRNMDAAWAAFRAAWDRYPGREPTLAEVPMDMIPHPPDLDFDDYIFDEPTDPPAQHD